MTSQTRNGWCSVEAVCFHRGINLSKKYNGILLEVMRVDFLKYFIVHDRITSRTRSVESASIVEVLICLEKNFHKKSFYGNINLL